MRAFDFDRTVSHAEAVRVIRSGLDDEGLALLPPATKRDDVYSVLVDGYRRVLVPEDRIVPRETVR